MPGRLRQALLRRFAGFGGTLIFELTNNVLKDTASRNSRNGNLGPRAQWFHLSPSSVLGDIGRERVEVDAAVRAAPANKTGPDQRFKVEVSSLSLVGACWHTLERGDWPHWSAKSFVGNAGLSRASVNCDVHFSLLMDLWF